jgi:3-oxoacyl-[acyl-carrier-protein] synthase II
MESRNFVITGMGVVAPNGVGKAEFWDALERGDNSLTKIDSFATGPLRVNVAGEVKNFVAKSFLGSKGLRNLDRSALFLLVAAKQSIEEAHLEINDITTDDIGITTGTTFSHLWSIFEFDKEVYDEGIDFANPVLFPSNVMNAASSHVSIRFNIQGFNTTISSGFTSSLEALQYSINAIQMQKAEAVLAGAVETLNFPLYLGFQKLGYMAGLKGEVLSCPFDRRRNGPLLAEAGVMFCVEDIFRAKQRNVKIFAKIKSISSFFSGYKIGKVDPQGEGLEKAIKEALDAAGVGIKDIDYISSCANSSLDLDKIEVKVLRKIFGDTLDKIPASSIKSMIGESLSASGGLQVLSTIGAMNRGIIPPTINYKEKDYECDIDCVPNKAQKKDVHVALITSFGPGGHNSACILERSAESDVF